MHFWGLCAPCFPTQAILLSCDTTAVMADILAMVCMTVFDGVITECGITRERGRALALPAGSG